MTPSKEFRAAALQYIMDKAPAAVAGMAKVYGEQILAFLWDLAPIYREEFRREEDARHAAALPPLPPLIFADPPARPPCENCGGKLIPVAFFDGVQVIRCAACGWEAPRD